MTAPKLRTAGVEQWEEQRPGRVSGGTQRWEPSRAGAGH